MSTNDFFREVEHTPVPLNLTYTLATTNHWYSVEKKFRSATLNWNSVFPVGIVTPFFFFDTKPNVAFPVSIESGKYAPSGDENHPPHVTKPPSGSQFT